MFSFFKRTEKESAASVARLHSQVRKPARNAGLELREPPPVPQVTEGNEDSDWAMWQDSVLEQDSQLHSQFHDTVPSRFTDEHTAVTDPDVDPFAKVSKHAP